MTLQDKIIGALILIHSTLGVLWTFWVGSEINFPVEFVAPNLALAALGIGSGTAWLKRRWWAAFLAMAFFLAQLVHVFTPTLQWSFTLGLYFNIALGWFSGVELGINLAALVMLIWVGARAFAPNDSFKPTSLRDPA